MRFRSTLALVFSATAFMTARSTIAAGVDVPFSGVTQVTNTNLDGEPAEGCVHETLGRAMRTPSATYFCAWRPASLGGHAWVRVARNSTGKYGTILNIRGADGELRESVVLDLTRNGDSDWRVESHYADGLRLLGQDSRLPASHLNYALTRIGFGGYFASEGLQYRYVPQSGSPTFFFVLDVVPF